MIARCAETLRAAYEGTSHEPLAALFIITAAADWEFYFTPVMESGGCGCECVLGGGGGGCDWVSVCEHACMRV